MGRHICNQGFFYHKLVEDIPTNIKDLHEKIEAQCKGEEANRRKQDLEKLDKKQEDKNQGSTSGSRTSVHDRLNFKKGRKEPKMPADSFTHLIKPRAKIFTLHREVFRSPVPLTTHPHKRNWNLWCFCHNDHGHDTEECNDLKKEIEDCLKRGMLLQYVQQGGQPRWQQRPLVGRGFGNRGGGRSGPHYEGRGGPQHGGRGQQQQGFYANNWGQQYASYPPATGEHLGCIK